MKLAFIGLGVMGFHMAGHLARQNNNLSVFNRTRAKAEAWAGQFKGGIADSVMDVCSDADVVFCCLGDDPDVEQVALGQDGILSAMQTGTTLVDHTTTSAHLAEKIYAAAEAKGIAFIDAPVSGGEAGAMNGTLTIMCGGDQVAFDRVTNLFATYGSHYKLIGGPGSGQKAKMVNQICIAGVVQGLSEALRFGMKAGLDMAAVTDVISRGAAQSWQMDNRASTMMAGEFEFGFAVDWMRKDLRICLEQARGIGASLPVTAIVDQFYADIQDQGGGRWDTSSLIHRLS
jgi:3-hydroxyisobutyrate dehydrogenase-like beta-hydroxyacid dehydrogenase